MFYEKALASEETMPHVGILCPYVRSITIYIIVEPLHHQKGKYIYPLLKVSSCKQKLFVHQLYYIGISKEASRVTMEKRCNYKA